MASQRWRATPAAQPVQRRLATLPRPAGSLRRARRLAGQSSRGPTVASSTGSRVRVARVAASGMSMPAKPMLRRNGTGSRTRASSPTATVPPLVTTDRPAVAMARWTAWERSWPAASSSRQRVTNSSE